MIGASVSMNDWCLRKKQINLLPSGIPFNGASTAIAENSGLVDQQATGKLLCEESPDSFQKNILITTAEKKTTVL